MTRRGGCAPRLAGCSASCLHRQLVEGYWAARECDERDLERETALYPAEVAEYRAERPLVTFKAWLIGHRRFERAA